MALPSLRRAENVAGDLYVDASCIDCDTCRWLAPRTFARRAGKSAVVAQPADRAQREAALLALVACPTASIGSVTGAGVREAAASFPVPVVGAVGHCGYHSAASFGAASYFVRRTDATGRPQNILVDAPRFAAPLAARLEALGGVALMALTHGDDVADHAKWAARFGCTRVIHARDASALEREGPVVGRVEQVRGDAERELLPGFLAIPTPGHTAGSMCFLWNDPGGALVLFSGDHVAYDAARGELEAWPDVCWHDWGEQTRSMQRLAEFDVDVVLPGHGRRAELGRAAMRGAWDRLVAWMESVDA